MQLDSAIFESKVVDTAGPPSTQEYGARVYDRVGHASEQQTLLGHLLLLQGGPVTCDICS